ncbi:copper-binding protein [Paraburkholderia silviterrae]|uniref:Copper-binding protein n=1 Tax=Paraburkholderia silviterrae TaxID=2528715 RepID=A0A4V2ZY63_9BURK|nr:copper-binding protein [Paraburkholderia silviterrae]TDG18407.1 copper-binding protein [Paraburkholderia silviterrae]
MKKLIVVVVALAAVVTVPAFADGDMAGMNLSSGPSATKAANTALTDAEVRKIDPATGLITLKHGALENLGMPPMTMAFKAKDPGMLKQVRQGDKVKVRIENVNGTLTIVKLDKQS